jgi:hypothetical protein
MVSHGIELLHSKNRFAPAHAPQCAALTIVPEKGRSQAWQFWAIFADAGTGSRHPRLLYRPGRAIQHWLHNLPQLFLANDESVTARDTIGLLVWSSF